MNPATAAADSHRMKLCVKSDRIGRNRRLEANMLYSLAGRSAYVSSRIRSNLRTLFQAVTVCSGVTRMHNSDSVKPKTFSGGFFRLQAAFRMTADLGRLEKQVLKTTDYSAPKL